MAFLRSILVLSSALAAGALSLPGTRTPSISPSMSSRRAAVAAASGFALASLSAGVALADDNEDAMARIAEKNRVALAAEKTKRREEMASTPSAEEQNADARGLVTNVLIGSVVLSVPFYCAPAKNPRPAAPAAQPRPVPAQTRTSFDS